MRAVEDPQPSFYLTVIQAGGKDLRNPGVYAGPGSPADLSCNLRPRKRYGKNLQTRRRRGRAMRQPLPEEGSGLRQQRDDHRRGERKCPCRGGEYGERDP